MEWHLKETGALEENETVGHTPAYISQKRMYDKLRIRYNIQPEYYGVIKTLELPSSHTRVDIVTNHAGVMIRSLLTDPRVSDEDYSFFNNDPFCPPPDQSDYIGDINTGLSFKETYRQRITDSSKQILIPVQLYADACTTGQFANLSVTQVKIALGIHNAKARDLDYLWRDLAFIPQVASVSSRGRRITLNSGHCDSIMLHQDVLDNEGVRETGGKITKLKDYHAMIEVCLEGYKAVQDGMFIDLFYRGNLYKDVECFFFVANIKVDNEEASKFCAQYQPKTAGIAQICRQCLVPTALSSRSLANYPAKLQADIEALVAENNEAALQEMSQHNFPNAFWGIHFGLHDGSGIHGACMVDILHTIYLGIFLRVRDAFFEQVGPTSQTAEDIDALAKEYGVLLARQSERNLPKSAFTKGIRGGKIMAKEFEGVLLLLAVVLQSSEGQNILRRSQSRNFVHRHQIQDWVLLLETLLQWVQWLKCDVMQMEHVKRSAWKHRYIMHLIKKIMNRTKGMGMRFIKFHILSHLTSCILNGGVPMLFDTGACETGHKPTKKAAVLTQKRTQSFDKQTNNRLLETHLLALAMAEIKGRPLWHYLTGYAREVKYNQNNSGNITKGTTMTCTLGDEEVENMLNCKSRYLRDSMIAEEDLVDFFAGLQQAIGPILPKPLEMRTEHSRDGQIFRAHTHFLGGVWRDWVEVDWGDDGHLPNKIWGFVDLTAMPPHYAVSFGGINDLQPAVYGIVESAQYDQVAEENVVQSEIMVPITKEVGQMTNGLVTKLKFYLADTEAFLAPLAVIPNVGGPANSYFVLDNRQVWKESFEEWLECPDSDYMFFDEEDDSEEEAYDETKDTNERLRTRDREDDDWVETLSLASGDAQDT
jgi:hypothetical protein